MEERGPESHKGKGEVTDREIFLPQGFFFVGPDVAGCCYQLKQDKKMLTVRK